MQADWKGRQGCWPLEGRQKKRVIAGKEDSCDETGKYRKIRRSFETQALEFESKALNFSKEEYLEYALTEIEPAPSDDALEVAAGTCACGRSFAPRVRTVVCLMRRHRCWRWEGGRQKNSGPGNMVFVRGYAEELPFLENSFTIVFSRLAFIILRMRKRRFRRWREC